MTSDPSQAKKVEDAVDEAIAKMRSLGAIIQDPADITSMKLWADLEVHTSEVIHRTEFKEGIGRYLAGMTSTDVKTLKDIIK